MLLNSPGATSGKSTLIYRFVMEKFEIICDPTLEDHYRKAAIVDGEECVLEIIDTCSIELFASVSKIYISQNDGFLLVFSVNSRASFDAIKFHQNLLKLVEDKPVVCESHLLIRTD